MKPFIMTAEGALTMVWPEKMAVLPGANVELKSRILPEVSLVTGWLLTEARGSGLWLPSFVPPFAPESVLPLVPMLDLPLAPRLVPSLVAPFRSWPVAPVVPPVDL